MEVAGKTILQHQVVRTSAMSIVSFEVARALNQRAGRLGIPTATRVFGQRMNVSGELMEHGEVVLHPKVLDEGDELARRFIVRASAREVLSSCHAFPANENIRARFPLFLLLTLPRQTSGNGNARTVSWTRGFDWTSRSKWHTCAPQNTCEESHQTSRIVWASMKEDSWMSCSG